MVTEIFICSSFPWHFAPFFVLLDFLSFWVLLMPFFLNFFIQASLSIVSFCVRDVLIFSSRTEKNFGNFVLIWFSTLFWYILLSHEIIDSYLPFGFQFLAWDHLYIIYCLPCFLSMGLLLSPPKTFLNVRWMVPQNSIPDLLILSYFTRIK